MVALAVSCAREFHWPCVKVFPGPKLEGVCVRNIQHETSAVVFSWLVWVAGIWRRERERERELKKLFTDR